MQFLQLMRRMYKTGRIALSGSLLLALLMVMALQAGGATAAPLKSNTSHVSETSAIPFNANAEHLREMVRDGQLASTVRVLNSLSPTTIEQFPLVPSGIKAKFPQATGLVTIVRGNRDNAIADTVTVDVQNMPPNITFTMFFIQFASKPFGNVEYVADLTTRGDGSGETIFQKIAFVAFAMDARNPGSSVDGMEGLASGIQLEHMGMWFSSLQDAQRVLNDDTLQGTIFDGGNPPLHAGPQAMTDGQTAPVF